MTGHKPMRRLPRHAYCSDEHCRAMRRCLGSECASAQRFADGTDQAPQRDGTIAAFAANDLKIEGVA